jgi:hypothetical protein
MALDSTFSLLSLPPVSGQPVSLGDLPRLAMVVQRNANRTWAFQIRGDSCRCLDGTILGGLSEPHRQLHALFGSRWLVLDHCAAERFDRALQGIQRNGGDAYRWLQDAGAVVVAPSPDGRLSGGSYASASLVQWGTDVGVRKVIRATHRLTATDGGQRLMREAEWLGDLPPNSAAMFPPLLEVIETESGVGYVTRFVSGYTLAELIFAGRLSAAEASQIVVHTLTSLRSNLYGRPHRAGARSSIGYGYPERIRRRTREVLNTPAGTGDLLKRLLVARRLVVNGVSCPGLPLILRGVDAVTSGAHVRNRRAEQAHGDLIFDDIVVRAGGQVCLLDPNGDTPTRLYDLGKLCLSLLTCYEFFKYDFSNVRLNPEKNPQ